MPLSIRSCPGVLVLLVIGAGCRSTLPTPQALHDRDRPTEWPSEARQQQLSYAEERVDALMNTGKFASKQEAEAFAAYEWSQQHNTARALSGEGTSTWSSSDAARARRKADQEQLHQDLRDLGPVGP